MTLKTDLTTISQAAMRQARADRAIFLVRLLSEIGRRIKGLTSGHHSGAAPTGLRGSAA